MVHAETPALTRTGPPVISPAVAALLVAGLAMIGLLAWDSIAAMIAIWSRLSAYNHCWLVLPIAGYLAWTRRDRMVGLQVTPFWPGLIVVLGFATAWLLARGAAIAEGEQIAVIGMFQGFLLTVLGTRICRAQILPILYLWLLVPTGSSLIPTLQTISTWQTVQLLALTPIPTFFEENLIQIPVGLFFVAPGCAGLNFLLASLALSVVYADMMYRNWQRKLACILIALVVAIVANGLRIFGILTIAELSQRQLAIVDDHLLYGWGFFLVILLIMMWVGRFFSNWEPASDELPASSTPSMNAATMAGDIRSRGLGRTAVAAGAAVVLAGTIITYARTSFAPGTPRAGLQMRLPQTIGGWHQATSPILWDGAFPDADIAKIWRFVKGSDQVDILIGHYWDQWEGHEVASVYNNATGPATGQTVGKSNATIRLNGVPRTSSERITRNRAQVWRSWRWYCAGNQLTSSAMAVRLWTMAGKLTRGDGSATSYTLFTTDGPDARARMQDFATALTTELHTLDVKDLAAGQKRNAACW